MFEIIAVGITVGLGVLTNRVSKYERKSPPRHTNGDNFRCGDGSPHEFPGAFGFEPYTDCVKCGYHDWTRAY